MLEVSAPTIGPYPIWALVVVLFINAFKGYLPLMMDAVNRRKCEDEVIELKLLIESLREQNADINRKYLLLVGAMSMIRKKLADHGYEDLPDFETLKNEE